MVKCSECGFLALRNRDNWELISAYPDYRKNGALNHISLQTLDRIPICFAMAADLQVEIESIEPQGIAGEPTTPP